jgi:hypothetical protein
MNFSENLSLEENAIKFLGPLLHIQILCMTHINYLLYKQNAIQLYEIISHM